MKNTLKWIKRRLDNMEEKINELKNIAIEIIQNKIHGEKRISKWRKRSSVNYSKF